MEARITHIEEKHAILELKDNQKLELPVEELPPGSKEGMKISLKLESFTKLNEANSLKELLNNILQEDGNVS